MSDGNWRDKLVPFEDVTVDDLREAMRRIPQDIVERLAEGPHPLRHTCNVCRAFGRRWYTTAVWDRENPLCVIFCYHEVPKIRMKDAQDQWTGEAARDVYNRCLDIYRVAGWPG